MYLYFVPLFYSYSFYGIHYKCFQRTVSLTLLYIHLYSPFLVDNETHRNEQTDRDSYILCYDIRSEKENNLSLRAATKIHPTVRYR